MWTALNSSERVVMGIVDGPVYRDSCGHKPEHYVCSFTWGDFVGEGERRRWYEETVDMYVHDYNGGPESALGQGLCLRYGSDDPEYRSGTIQIALQIAAHEPYRTALAILWRIGEFRWHPKSLVSSAHP